jgi:antitoxin HicB
VKNKISPKSYLQKPYSRIVIPTENGDFHAEILEFPGCYAQGKHVAEAYKNLERAAISWIQATTSEGNEIPAPFSSLGYGGKIALRLPKSIHKRAAQMAQRDRTSLNSFLLSAVSAKVGAEDFYNLLAAKFELQLMAAFTGAVTAFGKYRTVGLPATTNEGNRVRIENRAVTQGETRV